MDLPAAAAVYANAGVPVFPCAAGSKQPLTRRGFLDATANPIRVGAWWRRWPEANIGLPTGAVSGVDVVDVDVREDGDGYGAIGRARAAGLVDGWAWLVRTPSGGRHAYFLRSPGATGSGEQRSWSLPSCHVDFRGDGGYVIAPPSRLAARDGPTHYELVEVAQHDSRPVYADRLREFLDPRRPVLAQQPAGQSASSGRNLERLAEWVAAQPEGGRNQGLFWAACRMVEDGYGFDHTYAVLGDAARSAGLPEVEVERTIRSAHRTAHPAPHRADGNARGPCSAIEAVRL